MILILVNRIRLKFFSNSWNSSPRRNVIDDSCNAIVIEHSSRVVNIFCTTPSFTAPITAPFFYAE